MPEKREVNLSFSFALTQEGLFLEFVHMVLIDPAFAGIEVKLLPQDPEGDQLMDKIRGGDIVALYRNKCGLTQGALGMRVGVSSAGISRIEKGSLIPSDEQIVEIAKVLKIDKVEKFRNLFDRDRMQKILKKQKD